MEAGDTASKTYPLMTTHRIPRTAVIRIASSSMGLSSDVGLRTLPAILCHARRQVNAERYDGKFRRRRRDWESDAPRSYLSDLCGMDVKKAELKGSGEMLPEHLLEPDNIPAI